MTAIKREHLPGGDDIVVRCGDVGCDVVSMAAALLIDVISVAVTRELREGDHVYCMPCMSRLEVYFHQEMVVFPANLWAGGLTVEGVFDDQPVTGDCFTEMVGVDEPFGRSLLHTGRPRRWEMVQPRDGVDDVDPLAPPAGGVVVDAGPPVAVESPPPPDAPAASSTETAAAAETYRLRCAPCHGPDGRGHGPAAPALDPPPRDFSQAAWQAGITDDQIARAILEGGSAIGRSPAMPANPDLVGEPATVEALRQMIRAFGAP